MEVVAAVEAGMGGVVEEVVAGTGEEVVVVVDMDMVAAMAGAGVEDMDLEDTSKLSKTNSVS